MERKVEVAIIGSGTAGLSAWHEIKKLTQDVIMINGGEYGTTCARVGCMPSKVLIQCANDFHHRHYLAKEGMTGGENIEVNIPTVMKHVRTLRDQFVAGVMKGGYKELGERNLKGYAKIIEPTLLEVNGKRIRAQKVIIATGSTPIVPKSWREKLGSRLLTSDEIFELEDLPRRIAVVGLGVIGLELGQAMARLGIEVFGVNADSRLGGLSDPEVSAYAKKIAEQDMEIALSPADIEVDGDAIFVKSEGKSKQVDAVLVAMGRRPNIDGLGLENLGLPLDKNGLPPMDHHTMQVAELPVYIAGDVMGERTVLHEAADEGRIAGFNAMRATQQGFKRRVKLGICFSDPNIGIVGQSYQQLKNEGVDFVEGSMNFEGQSRAIVKGKNKGLFKVYGERKTGRLLGGEFIVPDGEHLAHLLAWAIQCDLTGMDALRMPFYHPVLEEGMRSALRNLCSKAEGSCSEMEIAMCESGPDYRL
jgi:dihydrolipoamide dehydrogenase